MDGEGGMASLITTIGHDFGSLVYVPEGSASFLNTAMVELRPAAGPAELDRARQDAVLRRAGHRRGARRPGGVRPCGGSGGYRILSGVVHAFVNVLDHGMAAGDAVDAPRV